MWTAIPAVKKWRQSRERRRESLQASKTFPLIRETPKSPSGKKRKRKKRNKSLNNKAAFIAIQYISYIVFAIRLLSAV